MEGDWKSITLWAARVARTCRLVQIFCVYVQDATTLFMRSFLSLGSYPRVQSSRQRRKRMALWTSMNSRVYEEGRLCHMTSDPYPMHSYKSATGAEVTRGRE